MVEIKLEPPCPTSVNGLGIDPNPNWTFNDLLSELNSLQLKLGSPDPSINPRPFVRTTLREVPGGGRRERNERTGFVMRVDDSEFDESDDEDGGDHSRSLVVVPGGGRFVCDDVFFSETDDSEDETMPSLQVARMDKMGVAEGAFFELTREHHLGVKEEMRNQLVVLETQLVAEKEKSNSCFVEVEKTCNARRELDRKQDMHYQRKIAEALDNHLTAIQRDHEHISQIEERRLWHDAALEEAKRKEKAKQEEILRQQRAKAEEEARHAAAKRAEEKKAEEEAQRAKEAADKSAADSSSRMQNVPSTTSTQDEPKTLQSTSDLVRAAESALKLEGRRLQNYKELEEKNQSIISGSNVDLRPKEREIARRVKQITGSIDSVRSKASELVKIFTDPTIPQSVTVAMFAKKIISIYETPNANFTSSAFACGYVIVYVCTQVPVVMDCLLAEFHKVCIYTVPKHISYSKTAFESKESYMKAIGYREEDGTLETVDQFLERIGSYMKLFGALVQTEAQGVQNMHGLEQGWIWLARFLNALPANLHTAVALEAFLRMAGYALHRKYKSQFRKMLNAISQQFVETLKSRKDPRVNSVITRLQDYIDSKKFLDEPEGWRLQGTLLSRSSVPEEDYHQQNYNNSYRNY